MPHSLSLTYLEKKILNNLMHPLDASDLSVAKSGVVDFGDWGLMLGCMYRMIRPS